MTLELTDPRGVAVGRTLVGLTMMAHPGLVPSLLGVDEQTRARSGFLVQMLGAREVALGLGALTAGADRRRWLLAGVLSDAVDAVVVAQAVAGRRARRATGAGDGRGGRGSSGAPGARAASLSATRRVLA